MPNCAYMETMIDPLDTQEGEEYPHSLQGLGVQDCALFLLFINKGSINMNRNQIEKHRPYLTLGEMELLVDAAKNLPIVPEELCLYLDRYIQDIKLRLRKANVRVKQSVDDSLGLYSKPEPTKDNRYDPEMLYTIYTSNGNSYAGMDVEQIRIVKEYLLQVTMSDEEVNAKMMAEFESAPKISKEQALKNLGMLD